MCPQMACICRCILTFVAFVGFFLSACFHICPQIAVTNKCNITMVAVLYLISFFVFNMTVRGTSVDPGDKLLTV